MAQLQLPTDAIPSIKYCGGGASAPAVVIWHVHGNDLANHEGWNLFTRDDNHQMEIETIAEWYGPEHGIVAPDDMTKPVDSFPRDDEAVEHIVDKAGKGSRLHLLAMYLEGRTFDQETWVPNRLLDPAKIPATMLPKK